MNRLIGIVILFSFILQTFKGAFVLLDYYANPASFSINCINKSKPNLHCNGKCQVFKKIEKQEQKDQQLPERKTANKLEVIVLEASQLSFKLHLLMPLDLPIHFYQNQLLTGSPKDFFHPPQA